MEKAMHSRIIPNKMIGNKMCNKVLIDTSVWISYFGRKPDNEKNNKRSKLASEVIKYCQKNKIDLFFCAYIESELKNEKNIESMKKISKKVSTHFGNDFWDENDVNWEECGSKWGDKEEGVWADELKSQLPDKKKKSNRVDRNIVLTAIQQNINIILHENPKDFNRLSDDRIQIIDLCKLNSLEDFKRILLKRKSSA